MTTVFERLDSLRNGWKVGTVADFAEVNPRELALPPDAPFVPMDAVKPGARWVSATQLRESRSGARFSGGDILFARITPCLENGKVAQWPFRAGRAGGSTEFIVLRAKPDVDPSFLYYWASSPQVRDAAAALMVGSTGRQRLSPTDLAAIPIALPPFEAQRRIAGLLEKIDDQIALSRAESERTLQLLNGVRRKSVDQSANEARPLGAFLKAIEGGRSLATLERAPEPGERAVLKVSAVKPGLFLAQEAKALPPDAVMPERAAVHQGDVLMTRANTAELVGAVCRVDVPADKLFLSDKTLRLVWDEDVADPRFFVHALSAPSVREQLALAATGTSGSMKNVSQEKIRALLVRAPARIDEQRALATAFDAALAVVRSIERCTEALQNVRSGLLSVLLSGTRTIPDSYDRFLSSDDELSAQPTFDPIAV